MQFASESIIDNVVERTFNLNVNGEAVPGVIWTPNDPLKGKSIVLMGHGGSQHKKFVSLLNRAQIYAGKFGFAVVAIDAPGHGERTPSEQSAQFVAELQKKMATGESVSEIVANEMTRLAAQAIPEWQAALDAVQTIDEIGEDGPVGYWGVSMGGAIGVPLVAAESRISAAVLGLAGLTPGHKALTEIAASINVPVEFVLQWDDELIPRDSGIALFDAIGSQEKSLHANPGGHGRIPAWEYESWERFFSRHLKAKTLG